MLALFRDLVASTLPSEERLRTRLSELSARDWANLAEIFAATLPEIDAVIALPGAAELAGSLARARGVMCLGVPLDADVDRWLPLVPPSGEVVLITAHLWDGEAELEATARATEHGLRVVALAAAVERTTAGARRRFESQGVRVYTALQLADTPEGLVFERRAPKRWKIKDA